MAVGFRVLKRRRKVDAQWAEKYRNLPVANVSDSMFRMAGGGARLRPYHSGGTMAGPALTVRTAPGDNLMVHWALNIAEQGDIIVVDARRFDEFDHRRAHAGLLPGEGLRRHRDQRCGTRRRLYQDA